MPWQRGFPKQAVSCKKLEKNPDPSAYVRGLPSSTWALTSCQAHFLADGRWTQRMPELQLKGTECSEYLLITGERRKGQGQGGGGEFAQVHSHLLQSSQPAMTKRDKEQLPCSSFVYSM